MDWLLLISILWFFALTVIICILVKRYKKIAFFPCFVGLFILILSLLFFEAYIVNHTYYFDMLANIKNWTLILFWLLSVSIFLWYMFSNIRKTWKSIFIYLFVSFALVTLIVWLLKWGYASFWWYFIELINYIILFSYFIVILLWSFSLWNFLLKNINFKESIYNFSIKFGLGFAILSIVLYFVVMFQFINVYVSYFIFAILLYLIYKNLSSLKDISKALLNDFVDFVYKVNSLAYVKYLFYFIGLVALFYIFIGFNYTFIAYPTARDASHAYIFYPKVFADYNGYPWSIDFRPWYILWSAVLAWVAKLWFWTWFSQDTWMITFNFISGVLSLFFGFMLVNAIVKILDNKKDIKHYLLIALWYILVLTWLTSGMGAFLVFVDNKTDLAVLMYVLLWLFLLIYSISTKLTFVSDEHIDKLKRGEIESIKTASKNTIFNIFMALSWFFFAIANLIKPTATFDFFEAVLVFVTLHTWFLLSIWAIVFVIWVLSYLKYRWFDKAVDSKYAMSLIKYGLWAAFLWLIDAFVRNRKRLLSLIIFVWVFILTLLVTKWTFGLVKEYYDWNVNKDPKKIVQAILMWNNFPVIKKDEFTGALYQGLKEPIGSSYNEDNNRYKWYWEHNFWDVWWSFAVPPKYKDTYCVSFTWANCGKYDSKYADKIINEYAFKILNYRNKKLFDTLLDKAIKNQGAKNVAKIYGIDITNKSDSQLLAEIKPLAEQNIKQQIFQDIKKLLKKGVLDIRFYPSVVQTKWTEEVLNYLKNNVVYYTNVHIPYDYLIPFTVTFNWYLQNKTSYYTDIGIIWLILWFILIISLFYSIFLLVKSFIQKDEDTKKYSLLLFSFSLASLVGWWIWYFVAAWIVWYNIWGIIWLILVSIIFVSKLKDRFFLIYVLIFFSILSIILNLFRIATQWWEGIYIWYRSSVWKKMNYVMENNWFKPKKEIKIPYVKEDVFNLQFPQYRIPIRWFNEREKDEIWLIGGTYIKYFIKNQNKIKDDQFLLYLRKLSSDNNLDKFYERLKDKKVTDILLDPNITSVVMWKWNIELWYRYFGKVDSNWNFVEKWVLPKLVDLAEKWKLDFITSNNLWIKYALTYKDEELAKILNISDLDKVRKIKYELIVLNYLRKNIWYDYPSLADKMENEWINAYTTIVKHRLDGLKYYSISDIAWDLIDVKGLDVDKNKIRTYEDFLRMIKWFDDLSFDEKLLIINLNWYYSVFNSNNPEYEKVRNKMTDDFIKEGLQQRWQLFYVKVK